MKLATFLLSMANAFLINVTSKTIEETTVDDKADKQKTQTVISA